MLFSLKLVTKSVLFSCVVCPCLPEINNSKFCRQFKDWSIRRQDCIRKTSW